ncbi:leucine-rich repeat receptor-like serine/threonine-protein kinase BAM2 [Impatiens glandulifera]|uniref:leucine-rich repeat receptor-like serine/threonine-protein kinase BAM2 n=1 Tax=Impatiens glandulifera TaxID=253017 RepID=UPI001FB0AD28|nr:leucine-rich repeat receptor-like serine/threonine-protein kinase BAM2 [Impatiens glandulifera]
MSNFSFFSIFIILIFRAITVQPFTLPSDVIALQAFKASITPSSISHYSCLSSWNFSSDPCSSPRVTHFTCGLQCQTTSIPFRVTRITLDSAGYSAVLSPRISDLTQLLVLDVSYNKFTGSIPSSLSTLSNLQSLVLHSNYFSGSVPPSIGYLKSLQLLDLSHNSLSGFLPNTLNSLSSMTRLDISFNKFTGSLPALPRNLIELAAMSNSLSGPLSKSSFDGLTLLEVVELSANSFNGDLEGWFLLLPSLQQVNLANNSLTGVEIKKPTALDGSSLVAIDLSFNNIDAALPAELGNYPALSSVSLRYNKFRGPIPSELGKDLSLKRLFLDGNFLNGIPPEELFSSNRTIFGSLGDNCFQNCPASTQLCSKSQKPQSICRQAYGGNKLF